MMKNQVDKETPEMKPTPDVADSCSCNSCDSLECFACRQNKCCPNDQCKDSKISIFYESKEIDLKVSHSDSSNFHASMKKSVSTHCCMKKKMETDKPTMDKSKYADLESKKMESDKPTMDKSKYADPESKKMETDKLTMDKSKYADLESKKMETDKLTMDKSKYTHQESKKMETDKPTLDKSKYAVLESKFMEELEKICKTNMEFNRAATIEQDVAVKNSDKELEDSVGAKLSAQIMKLSYRDFKQSLSHNKSNTSAAFKVSTLSKYDLFQKIKEVYKACSCKVCECLVGKSTRNDACECKPCECNDCMSYLENMQYSESGKTLKNCCRQYDTTFAELSEIAKKLNDSKNCKCKPCECIECADYSKKPCNCEPCQCVECKSMRVRKPIPVIVAPVIEYTQRNWCPCSPCECIECTRRTELSSNVMHEMATGTNIQRHAQCRCELCQNEACEPDGVGSCKCDRRNRVMCKPVERDAHEYDIRTVLVNNPAIRKPNRHDTIAMFAALSNNYPNFTHDNTRQCTCDECEYLMCNYKEDFIDAIKSSQLFTLDKLQLDKKSSKTCRPYEPRECELCCKYKESQSDRQKCLCDICSCDNCRRQKGALTTKQIGKSECECRLCECNNCDKLNIKLERQCHYDTCMMCKRCDRDDIHSSDLAYTAKSVSTSYISSLSCRESKYKMKSQQETLSVYYATQTLAFPQPSPAPNTTTRSFDTTKASMSDNKSKRKKKPKSCYVLQCDAYTQYKNRNKGLYKSNSMEYKAYGSYYSDSSSIKTNSKSSSYSKDNGSVTRVSGHKNNSCESSCNSSGYDHPDYLVQFPKSTVETCLKDVLKLKLDKKNPNLPIRKRYVNSASTENTVSSKKRLSQAYAENRKYKKLYHQIDAKRSSDRRLKRQAYNEDNYTPLQRNYSKKIAAHSQKYDKPCCSPAITRENIPIYITKNKCTHTGEHGPITESVSSIRIDGCERKNYNRRNLQTPKNYKEFQISGNVYDYNVPNQRVIQNDQFLCNCSHTSPFTYFSNSIGFFKIDEDYKRIQKTLLEAKDFTSDLMKILEKCERDHREFESVSKNLKLLHPSTLDYSPIKNKEINDAKTPLGKSCYKNQHFNEMDNELRQIHIENSSMEEKMSMQVFPKRLVNGRIGKESTVFQQTLDINNINTRNRLNMVIVSQENPNELVNSIKNVITTTASKVIGSKENDNTKQALAEADKDPTTNKSHTGKIYKKIHRNYRNLMKRVIVSKKISVKNTDKNDSKPAVMSATTETCNTLAQETVLKENIVTPTSINTTAVGQSININESKHAANFELDRVMRKLDAVFASTTEISVCTSIEKMDHKSVKEGSTTMQTQDMEGRKPWPISKKNFALVQKVTKGRGGCIFPTFELEMKEAVKSISLQTRDKVTSKKHAVGLQAQNENSHPTNTKVEMGKMLDTPSHQQPVKEESNVCKDNSNIRRKSKLELELKDPPKAISLQTSLQKMDYIDKKIINDLLFNSTTEDIERQVKDLLNLSLLQPIMKLLNSSSYISVIDTENRLPRIESSKSSCEALKASFLDVRRVSDHTVLVKWNLPRDVSDVQGYELLVDGRAVQKIFSPSKSMAVITCLPHAEKLLLTIRTITAMVTRTGHYPAASIVYHPRIK